MSTSQVHSHPRSYCTLRPIRCPFVHSAGVPQTGHGAATVLASSIFDIIWYVRTSTSTTKRTLRNSHRDRWCHKNTDLARDMHCTATKEHVVIHYLVQQIGSSETMLWNVLWWQTRSNGLWALTVIRIKWTVRSHWRWWRIANADVSPFQFSFKGSLLSLTRTLTVLTTLHTLPETSGKCASAWYWRSVECTWNNPEMFQVSPKDLLAVQLKAY